MVKINNINHNNQNKIILKASAGTGKTYRLSLEYIANLIRGVNYKNIVVMTFTKKATAEIKERIGKQPERTLWIFWQRNFEGKFAKCIFWNDKK